jgi:hypothetical protein
VTVCFCNWLCKTVCRSEVDPLLTCTLLMYTFRFVISMSGFRFQLGSVYKPWALIKLKNEPTRFENVIHSSYFATHGFVVYYIPTTADCGSDFSVHFSTLLSLMTVVARGHLVTIYMSWIPILQNICSPVTVPFIVIIFRIYLISVTTAKNAVS